jgi:hypothetical protein
MSLAESLRRNSGGLQAVTRRRLRHRERNHQGIKNELIARGPPTRLAHTTAMRCTLVERFAFVDANTINYEATLEDPKAYTRPWKIAFTHKRTAEQGFELLENACYEGLQGAPH